MAQHTRYWYLLHMLKTSLYAFADVFNRARGLNFGLSLHQHPYFMYASSKGSGFCVGSPVRAFVVLKCDKYRNRMCWLISLQIILPHMLKHMNAYIDQHMRFVGKDLVPVKCIKAPKWLWLLSVLRRWFCCCWFLVDCCSQCLWGSVFGPCFVIQYFVSF